MNSSWLACMLILTSAPIAGKNIYMGVGSQTCGQWLDARDKAHDHANPHREAGILLSNMMTSWIQGFLVGMAAHDDDTNASLEQIPEVLSLEAWVDQSCREKPLQNILDATVALRLVLVPPKK